MSLARHPPVAWKASRPERPWMSEMLMIHIQRECDERCPRCRRRKRLDAKDGIEDELADLDGTQCAEADL